MHERLLVIDYDATITEDDVLDRAAMTFAETHVVTEETGALDGSPLTLHDVLRLEYAAVRSPRHEVIEWVLANARIRAGFHDLVALASNRGWPLVVLSSGFHTLIAPVLEREGLGALTVIANDVQPHPDGWKVTFRDESMCEVCGEACKRRTLCELEPASEVVYVGDGYSDRCAATAADRVFARSGLARYLSDRSVTFARFETFHEIVAQLSE
ncbi:MAG: HAD-IB family phosphatase [Gaiellaceae bacterium]